MSASIDRDARAVLLPAFDTLDVLDIMVPFLKEGGCSVLLGETRAEYVARAMSTERLACETPDGFRASIAALQAVTPHLIVAVDQELGGIQRLAGLVPPLPTLDEAHTLSPDALAERCRITAQGARALGVSMFLAPIADIIDGQNVWLRARTMGSYPQAVARLVSAFVTGVQAAGITAVTKHFPGFNDLAEDPALADVCLATPLDRILHNLLPFKAAIEAGTKVIMTGPAPVAAIDGNNSASTSPAVMAMLRSQLGFKGLIVSDDLDAPATLRGQSLLETAIASLNAGADLLLVAGGPHLSALSEGIAAAAQRGDIEQQRLADAAARVRQIAGGG
ncbi:glycoside hydrolase family 3 N-terminal domain-containing protein [Shinella zoogloeoides]|uniref:glycoside hydrolase family 3 N-terminal domain-containing protein n=1 Tax=Shinella zoogloeoides TaxID=352475 RepID=UPI000E65B560|nr:glycoside hydrolase family 3 N-terminal domain-containing protein [Shinella zoogloeoides]